MKNLTFAVLALFAFLSSSRGEERIRVKGSDTMVILAQRWAEGFMTDHKDVIIEVTGGGSGQGIAALKNGSTDICNASRPMNEEERNELKRRYGTRGIEIKCAMDGISFYVNETNPVKELTVHQIKGIFSGEIKNWKQVGGMDEAIQLYGRESVSGTYVFFQEHILHDVPFSTELRVMPGTAMIVDAVAHDVAGIGYGGAAYARHIKELSVKTDSVSVAFAPTFENIASGDYPVSRYLYMYLRKAPSGTLKRYLDWILSAHGQEIVRDVGYFPLISMMQKVDDLRGSSHN